MRDSSTCLGLYSPTSLLRESNTTRPNVECETFEIIAGKFNEVWNLYWRALLIYISCWFLYTSPARSCKWSREDGPTSPGHREPLHLIPETILRDLCSLRHEVHAYVTATILNFPLLQPYLQIFY
jgi:hypothetical protein